jgi:hypothetical protein
MPKRVALAMCEPASDATPARASHSLIVPGIHPEEPGIRPEEVVIQPGMRPGPFRTE